ncbi:MAG: acetate/propionate family kinase [Georgfuchsia sp.]
MDAILTLNAGSSSIKFALFANVDVLPEQPEISGQIDGIGASPHIKASDKDGRTLDNVDIPADGNRERQHHAALGFLVDWLHAHEAGWRIVAVGHRVVHGADRYSLPELIDDASLDVLRGFIPLAPLHQPHNLAGIDALRAALPGVPQIACFDTAFHTTQPRLASAFALPRRISAQGVRRYGFHGLSYEYIAGKLPQYLGDRAEGRVIVAHLGNGASMCAMKQRASIATTMGFSVLDGLVMGTRSGTIDPGVLLYLLQSEHMDADALANLLYKESGLLGVSGLSQDMRALLASDTEEAREAVDLFCYRVVREIGSLASALGGLDALVFTGGIGEHAAPVREQICLDSHWLGIELDKAANLADAKRISSMKSQVDVLVLPTNEEWVIARHAVKLADTCRISPDLIPRCQPIARKGRPIC